MDIDFYLLSAGEEGRIGMALCKYHLPSNAPLCARVKKTKRELEKLGTLCRSGSLSKRYWPTK